MVDSAFSARQIQITNEVEMLLRQMGGKLMPYVRMGSHVGQRSAVVRQLGDLNFSQTTTPSADHTYQDITHGLRFVEYKEFDAAVLETQAEQVLTANGSLVSEYAAILANAARRKQDDLILAALFGTARTGESGGSTEAFDTTNQVVGTDVGGTGSGLNPTKLDSAIDILVKGGVDFDNDEVICLLSAADESNLMRFTQLTSSDFTGPRPVLVDGVLSQYRGVKFVRTQYNNGTAYNLANSTMVASATVRYCPMFVKSGVYYGDFGGVQIKIDEIPQKRHAVQIAGYLRGDATRLENKKVVRMACTYASGA